MGNPTGPMPQDLLGVLPLLLILEDEVLAKKSSKRIQSNGRKKWIFTILFWSIVISSSISLISNVVLKGVNIIIACIVLALIIIIGVIFDIIGIAFTAADETPFHAMASKKIKGAKTAIKLIRNADKVSSFCNDVIGDVCGIVSGSAGAIIVVKLLDRFQSLNSAVMGVVVGTLIASATISFKSTGKSYAIKNSYNIVRRVSRILYVIVKDR
jgi:hypothetical protein